ncbi:MAG: T9SS type A sorting domain-containing protein [Alloprevotella sp.]|nr:T9SS type A sorting domain-containing protein [Alloprevotella sp.]
MTLIETDPIISVNGSNIRVQNGMGEVLEVYNITGLRVYSKKIEKADILISLKLPKGCYILKVGKTVRKFSIA